jgi:hypothetical protein
VPRVIYVHEDTTADIAIFPSISGQNDSGEWCRDFSLRDARLGTQIVQNHMGKYSRIHTNNIHQLYYQIFTQPNDITLLQQLLYTLC